MNLLPLLAGLACFAAEPAVPANPCANGSFEQLAPGGFPAAWALLGKVEVVGDAHSGKHALRLLRTTEPPDRETGINGRNIDRLRGGIDFYYKAVAAKDAVLHIYAIPIAADGIERTGAPRAAFAVPKDHVGDGKWHHARLKYDFTKNSKVKTVIFAARLEGTSGELLLDDFSYLDRVGTLLRVGNIALDEAPKQPGRRCIVRVPVENGGDEPAKDVRVVLAPPRGLTAHPTEIRLGDLAPDAKIPAAWTLDGERFRPAALTVSAFSGQDKATGRMELTAKWEVRSFGPVSPVAMVGQPLVLECELVNRGQIMLEGPTVKFAFGRQSAMRKAERMAPGQTVVVRATFVPREQSFCETTALEADGPSGGENYLPTDSVVVGAATPLPPPGATLSAAVNGDCAVLENEHLRLVFRRNAFGYGPGEIVVKTRSG